MAAAGSITVAFGMLATPDRQRECMRLSVKDLYAKEGFVRRFRRTEIEMLKLACGGEIDR
jgi:hypothetical protein